MEITVRSWGESGDGHFYVEKTDRPSAGTDYERRLHVGLARPTGLHISLDIRRVDGEERIAAGINLSPAEAVELVTHIAKVLGHGEWDA